MLTRNPRKEYVFTCDVCGKTLNTKKKMVFLASEEAQQMNRWWVYYDRPNNTWRHKCKICSTYI